ncbi:MAG: hypothetical protein ACK439_07860 [Novosphingobium sp.]|jgi:hypothetical protein
MTGKFKRSAAALALAASFSMMATPAMARHGWGGWGGGYRHHDRGVDGGDILAGILIIGGIAAIASAASKSKKEREQREYRDEAPDYRQDSRNYAGNDDRPEWRDGGGIDSAVNRCIDEVNRGRERVGEVDSVNRDADGWRIAGTTTGNGNFSCTIDRDGRIRNVNVDGRAI